MTFIQSIGVMIVAAAVVVSVARWLNMPTIVAYIVTGLVLGPLLGVLAFTVDESDEAMARDIQIIADAGIVLLLFLAGLDLSVDKIRSVGAVALYTGIGQLLFTGITGFVLAIVMQFDVMASIFIATALTNGSTVLVVKLLHQKNEVDHTYSHIAIGANLVKDVALIVVLTLVAALAMSDAEEAQMGMMAWNITRAMLGVGLFLVIALLASRYVLQRPFEWATSSPTMLFIWSLGWCFLFVAGAEMMGLSPAIGGFLAGVSLAQLRCSQELIRRVQPLMNFFIALFFVSVGAQMQIGQAWQSMGAVIVLSLFMLVTTPLACMWIIARTGYSERSAFLAGISMGQISELSFVFVALGLTAGLIDQSIVSLVTLVGLITIAISAYMILYNHVLYRIARQMGLLKIFRAGQEPEKEDGHHDRMQDHIVIVGMNALGRQLAQAMHRRGDKVLAIDTDSRKLAGLDCRTMVGNVDDITVLDEANLAGAQLGVSTLKIEDTNNLFAYRCGQLGVPSAIHAFDRSVLNDLRRLNVEYLIDTHRTGSEELRKTLQRQGVLPT